MKTLTGDDVLYRFAAGVNKGELVMSCARLAWSSLRPLMAQIAERQHARDSVLMLLNCISATTDKKKHKTSEVWITIPSLFDSFLGRLLRVDVVTLVGL